MDVHVTDTSALSARSTDDWTTYLESSGWTPAVREPGGTEWVQGQNEEVIWLPRSAEMRGYASRIAAALRTLATYEGRSESEILFDVTHASYDVQRLRLLPPGRPGTLSLADSANSLAGVRKWLQSGATSAALADHYYVLPSRRPAEVALFMNESKLAAPSEGSFIWNVITPVGQGGQTTLAGSASSAPEQTPDFGRKVTLTLYQATLAVKQAVTSVMGNGQSVADAFISRLERGVSANLCEGLIETSSESHLPLEVGFSWASTHAGPPTTPISFEPADYEVLADAAREFRSRTPESGVTIRGSVVRLVREGKLRPGEVTLAGIVEDDWEERFGHFWVELSETDYQQALRAHDEGAIVTATGDVVRVGNRRRIMNLQSFAIAPSSEPS